MSDKLVTNKLVTIQISKVAKEELKELTILLNKNVSIGRVRQIDAVGYAIGESIKKLKK